MTSTNLVLLRRVALCADEDPDDARVAVAGGSVQGGVAVLEDKYLKYFILILRYLIGKSNCVCYS